LAAREAELLPIPYFHLVFTLPHQLGPLALHNKTVVYGILFRAAADTVRTLAADRKHLGAQVGGLMVLHTWGQTLMHHPHIHAIVTGGGLSHDRRRWVACKKSKKSGKEFLIHVEVLSTVFRGKFMAMLKHAYRAGQLVFPGKLAALEDPDAFRRLLDLAAQRPWVVYAKRPFASAHCVLKYLARYTHRVAISNSRLLDLTDGRVRFQYKDYAAGQQTKTMQLACEEFIRRFLMHTLPSGFVRIRYFGFLANRHRHENLQHCRQLLGIATAPTEGHDSLNDTSPDDASDESSQPQRCPVCQNGQLFVIHTFEPPHRWPVQPPHILHSHTSSTALINSS
jgi:hypothetical protein